MPIKIIIYISLLSLVSYQSIGNITKSVGDTTEVTHLIDSAGSLINSDPNTSKLLLQEAIILSNELKYTAGKARSFNTLGILAYQKGLVDSAGYFFEQSLKQWEILDNKKQVSNLLGNLSIILASQNKLAQAISYNKKSLEVKLELRDTIPIANGFNNLGGLYHDMGDIREAVYFQLKALKLRKAIGDSSRLSASYINLGDLHNEMGNLDSAYYYGKEAISIQISRNNTWGLANSYGVLAEYFFHKNNQDSALWYVDESLNLAREIGTPFLIEEMILLKSNILIHKEETDAALENLLSLKAYTNTQMEITSFKILADIYRRKKIYTKASLYYKKYNDLNDSIQQANQKNKVAAITAIHFYELQELEIKNSQQIEREQNLAIIRQKEDKAFGWYVIIGLMGTLTIFCLFFFVRITQQNRLLKKQQKEIDQLVLEQEHVIEERTFELFSNKNAISKYKALNQHGLNSPLSKILSTVNLSSNEDISEGSLSSLKSSVQELEEAIRKFSKVLHRKNRS